jgi:hypothetical protein
MIIEQRVCLAVVITKYSNHFSFPPYWITDECKRTIILCWHLQSCVLGEKPGINAQLCYWHVQKNWIMLIQTRLICKIDCYHVTIDV